MTQNARTEHDSLLFVHESGGEFHKLHIIWPFVQKFMICPLSSESVVMLSEHS